MSIEPWHLSIFVTAGIVLLEVTVHALLRRRGGLAVHRRVRTGALGLLVVLTVVVAVAALGPSLADQLASVAAAVAAVAAAWLAYRSYQASADLTAKSAPAVEEPAEEPPVRSAP